MDVKRGGPPPCTERAPCHVSSLSRYCCSSSGRVGTTVLRYLFRGPRCRAGPPQAAVPTNGRLLSHNIVSPPPYLMGPTLIILAQYSIIVSCTGELDRGWCKHIQEAVHNMSLPYRLMDRIYRTCSALFSRAGALGHGYRQSVGNVFHNVPPPRCLIELLLRVLVRPSACCAVEQIGDSFRAR